MEETKRKIEVMQAYVEGKKIQVKACRDSEWKDCLYNPNWNWMDLDYRVKPEEKYRPYKDYREMVEDFCERFGVKCPAYEMPLIWLKYKKDGAIVFKHFYGDDDDITMQQRFDLTTYLDGSPVGKKEKK